MYERTGSYFLVQSISLISYMRQSRNEFELFKSSNSMGLAFHVYQMVKISKNCLEMVDRIKISFIIISKLGLLIFS